jgi:hypothetical protein
VNNFNIEKIHDTIWVFKNALDETDSLLEYINTKDWVDWYTFGKKTQLTGFKYNFKNFPTVQEWENKIPAEGDDNFEYFENKINNLFYETTKLYIEANNISLDNWMYYGWDVAKYHETPNASDDYIMMHHTDFQRNIAYTPGEKFGITAVFYLNDDYDGGEVMYRFLNNDDINIVEEDYIYKPGKGDVVVFLSGHPHYHGVKTVTKGEKYIIRNYWRYEYPGHPLWLQLEQKYGKEVWEQKEKERKKFNEDPQNISIINNIPFWMSFEDYYKEDLGNL